MRSWTSRRVPVDGGELTVGTVEPVTTTATTTTTMTATTTTTTTPSSTAAGHPVLAVHGITANQRCFVELADLLPSHRLIAPDLRGRGRSNRLPPPYGLVQHAEDLVRVLDDQSVERATVVGHSMGAFVAVRLAARHPDRVAAVILVDGGLPLPTAGPEALGPALDRLSMTFDDPADYLDFWRAHPALREDWSDPVEDYLRYDLEPAADAPGRWRPSAVREAVLADLTELDGREGYVDALTALDRARGPVTFLRAERGMLDQPEGLYPATQAEPWLERLAGVKRVEVADVNHYTILMATAGAQVVARTIHAADHELDHHAKEQL